MHYDIIGDIHGHAEELRQLLNKLDYQRSGHGYRHAERQAVFVGDFIDRGPANAEAVQIARATVEDGNGHAVMGNHEFNAIAFHTRRPDCREFFRCHTEKNQRQQAATGGLDRAGANRVNRVAFRPDAVSLSREMNLTTFSIKE